ncbi:MAG: exonuclease SbcCD subunit D [bacterium]|nr:exonuclease SbcCD subunit D [bacterium]
MPEPIRTLHFADTHIGIESYGKTDPATGLSSRVVDFLRRLDDIVTYARDHDVDLIIFAGDAFKTRTPSPTFQREFAHRIRDLSALAPVVMLVGNHDVPPTALKASSIEIYDTLAVPNVRVADSYEHFVIETKRGPVAIGTAPYPIRARILETVQTAGLTIAQIDNLVQDKLVEILSDLAEEVDAISPDIPRLLVGHFTTSGAVVGSERAIMLGRDITVPRTSLADPRWDYVALGHIHKHQNLTHGRDDVPPVVYSGSIERIDFGEEGDPKGFCWVELARSATTWKFIPLDARPFVTLKADLRADSNPTLTTIQLIERHNLRNAVVRMLLNFSPESESRFNENAVRDALRRSAAFFVAAVRKEVDQPARMRLGASPEGLTQLELVERYLISQSVPEERRVQLLELAQDVFNEANQDE